MNKTCKDKIKAKVEKANAKTKGRVKKTVAKAACALAIAIVIAGCLHPGEQAAKSETMNVTIRDSVIAVNIGAKKSTANCTSNTVELAESERTYDVTILSQAQSLESSGSETFGQTQTPTQDIKPDIDLHYNDAVGTGGKAASDFLSSLSAESFAALRDYIKSGKSGKVTVTKKDGTTETLDCADGSCSYSGGTITAADCDACTDCAPK